MHDPKYALPFDKELETRVNAYLKDQPQKQTSRLVGKEPATGAPYDEKEELPKRLEIKLPGGQLAKKAEVRSILDDINQLPPAKAPTHEPPMKISVDSLPPFPAAVLKDFAADYASWAELDDQLAKGQLEDLPVSKAVLCARQVLNKFNGVRVDATFTGTITPAVKDQTKKKQEEPARAISELEDLLAEMKAAAKKLTKEPSKRWRANFEYTLVR